MKLERTLQQYEYGAPSLIADGSRAQVIYFITDAKRDVATLARHLELLSAAAKSVLPENLCLTNKDVPDETVVPVDFTLGELRALHAAIVAASPTK